MIKLPIERVYEFLDKENMLSKVIAKNMDASEETINSALAQALSKLKLIKKILDGTKDLLDKKIEKREFTKNNICDIFRNDIEPLAVNKHYAIKISCNVEGEMFLHRSFFVDAMYNIIKNAESHAFDKNQKNAEIVFEIYERNNQIIIDYMNNGREFPRNMTTRDFLTIGKKAESSSGEGIGGAWIGKVIEAHNGLFEIIRDNNPVHFRITLPKEI